MRSFAEERKEGTYILLATRPLSDWQIVLAKYFSCMVLLAFSLIPTFFYYYSIYHLGMPEGNVDTGAILGSYAGLLLLGATFAAIGLFASSITNNQVIAFSLSVFACFIAYSGFDAMSKIYALQFMESWLLALSVNTHYQSISRGVLDTRDLVYFISMILVFLGATKMVLGGRKW